MRMKNLNTTFFATGIFLLGSFFSNAATASIYKPISAGHVYVPRGFDTNDDVQIVVAGNLPNLCYKSPRANTKIDGNTISIEMVALFNNVPHTVCAEELVPYLQVVSLGTLEKGAYEVQVKNLPSENGDKLIKEQLNVKATDSVLVDDFIYAAVDSVDHTHGTNQIVLKGYNPSDCYTLDHVEFKSNGRDTYAVLPIMKRKFDPASICPLKPSPFAYSAEVPTELNADPVLLHVRTMNGNSFNRIYSEQQK